MDVGRREVLKRLSTVPLATESLGAVSPGAVSLGGISLTTALAEPALAAAIAAQLDRMTLELPDGHMVNAALALPGATPAPAVLLIHEWWGLNDQIKTVAAELAREGYVALAIDLMNGKVATTPAEAQTQVTAINPGDAMTTLSAWIDWLRHHPGVNGKIATLGWCLGGGWSLTLSLAVPITATILYYGRCAISTDQARMLTGPVLGHFAKRDRNITPEMVEGFRASLMAADRPHEIYSYDADHAFANPTGNRYDQEDAALAWTRTLAFLARTLRG